MPQEDIFGAGVITLRCFTQVTPNETLALQGSEATLHLAIAQPKLSGESRHRRVHTAVFSGIAGQTCPEEFCCWAETAVPHERVRYENTLKQVEWVEGLPQLHR